MKIFNSNIAYVLVFKKINFTLPSPDVFFEMIKSGSRTFVFNNAASLINKFKNSRTLK